MLASLPASMLNQNKPDLGIPNRINLTTSRSSWRFAERLLFPGENEIPLPGSEPYVYGSCRPASCSTMLLKRDHFFVKRTGYQRRTWCLFDGPCDPRRRGRPQKTKRSRRSDTKCRSQPCLYMMHVIPLTVQMQVLFVRHEASLRDNLARVGEVRTFGIGSNTGSNSTMPKSKLLSIVAIISTMIATPGMAQQAVQEPGLRAFYQSLGVGSGTSATASVRSSGSYASAPAKHHAHASAKHHVSARKL